MGELSGRFDQIVLLSAPAEVMLERLATRTNNPYGSTEEERAESLHYKETVEPLLRKLATIEIETTAPLDEVVAAVLDHVNGRPRAGNLGGRAVDPVVDLPGSVDEDRQPVPVVGVDDRQKHDRVEEQMHDQHVTK
jgi:broad-specificity NMP kinase